MYKNTISSNRFFIIIIVTLKLNYKKAGSTIFTLRKSFNLSDHWYMNSKILVLSDLCHRTIYGHRIPYIFHLSRR